MTKNSQYSVRYFKVTFPYENIALVEFDRPEKMNSINTEMWHNLQMTFQRLSTDSNVRCVLLTGSGDKAFSSGLDVQAASSEGPVSHPDAQADIARRTWAIRRHILDWQNCVSAIEKCEKPVIALFHGITFGAAIDIGTAADVRYCARNVKFCVKEVDVGLAADVGTLSRLPKIGVSYSWAKEVTYSARVFGAEEAARTGFVSRVLESKEDLINAGLEMAKLIASKSPVAVQSSKALFDFSRDRSVEDGLLFTATWNAAMVQAEDVTKAMMSGIRKTKPTFEKL